MKIVCPTAINDRKRTNGVFKKFIDESILVLII